MINKTRYFLVLALLLPVTLYAQTAKKTVTVFKKNDSQYVYENSRMNINHQVLFNAAGSSVAPFFGTGIAYARQFDRKNALHLEGFAGILPLSGAASASTIGTHYKRYVGNSFYYRAGLDVRDIAIRYNGALRYITSTRDIAATSDLTAAFVIGNQWQWPRFTLGVDWVGLNIPVTNISRHVSFTDVLSNQHKNDVEKLWGFLGDLTSAQLFRFYLGASF